VAEALELPDRRLPDDLRLRPPAARDRGQPQAGAAGDARAEADPTAAATGAQEAARLLPGRTATAVVAAGSDERVGGRARLDVSEWRSSTAAPARSSAGNSSCAAAPTKQSRSSTTRRRGTGSSRASSCSVRITA